MATHSSILAWRIPWTEESGRLSSRGRKESDTTERLSTHQKATRSQVGQEETPRVRGQGWWPRGATPRPRSVSVGEARRSHLAPEARGGDAEEPPQARGQGRHLGGATHARGQGRRPGGATPEAVAAQAQEGLEELSHAEGQEQRLRRYPSSKVRSNGCALLELP